MAIRAAHALQEARRVDGLAGTATVTPDWGLVAARIRDEATDDWNDQVAVDRFVGKGGTFVRGKGRLDGPARVAVGDALYVARRGVVIATGTRPAVPPIPGLDDVPYWTNREILEAKELPGSMIVLGGGAIGLELAQATARFGVKVTVVEALDRLAPREEPEAGALLAQVFGEEGIDVRVDVRAVEISGDTEKITVALDARVDGEDIRFGVSGLLRNSDLVMWDEATTSLWQQITGEAIVGVLAGTKLDLIPTSIVSFGDTLENHPDALSLSRETGFGIPYGANGYVGYSSSEQPFLFDGEPDPRFPALSRVVGVTIEGDQKAYPFERLSVVGVVNDVVAGVPIAVLWGGNTADALDGQSIADSLAIGTGIAFDRRVGDQELTFTSAGDDLFLEETNSTWTLLGRAIDGPLIGERLQTVTHRNEFWFAWAVFFAEAPVYGDG